MPNTPNDPLEQPVYETPAPRARISPFTFILLVFASILSFIFLGPLVGMIIVLPFFDYSIAEVTTVLGNLAAYPDARVPLLLFQGVAGGFAFIFIPWFLLWQYRYFDWKSLWQKAATPLGIGLTVLVTIIFMPANAIVIDWNQHVEFPAFMSEFEAWAQTKEAQLAEASQMMTQLDHFGEFLLGLLVVALIPAIGEELLFRGVIQRQLQHYGINAHVAIWFSAIFFSLFHLQFYGFVPRMLLGALFGYLFYWSDNLRLAMLAHFVNNGFTLTLLYLYQLESIEFNVEEPQSPSWFISLGAAAVCVFLLRVFYKHYQQQQLSSE